MPIPYSLTTIFLIPYSLHLRYMTYFLTIIGDFFNTLRRTGMKLMNMLHHSKTCCADMDLLMSLKLIFKLFTCEKTCKNGMFWWWKCDIFLIFSCVNSLKYSSKLHKSISAPQVPEWWSMLISFMPVFLRLMEKSPIIVKSRSCTCTASVFPSPYSLYRTL